MILRSLLFAAACTATFGQVVINEFAAASSDRLLQWTSDGSPRLGTGIPWQSPSYPDANWTTCALPAGWGTSVATNLQSAMLNKTPSAYFRKTFSVSPAQAALALPVTLQIDADDGFVAFINGVEVARANTGGTKHFVYAAQPAYNAVTAAGVIEYALPAANTILVPGNNVLAVQAVNKDLSSNFRLNAGLKIVTSTTAIELTKAFYDFNAATGATKTRQRTGTTDTNSSSGSPIAGGWLATATDPTTTGTWTSLNIVTGEIPDAGVAASGGLRYTISQTGANGTAAWLRSPAVDMSNAWSTGSLNTASLSATTVSFRYRTTGDLQFALRMDPALGQDGNSADGFPVIGLPIGGTPDYNWASAGGGYFGKAYDAAGVITSPLSGSINIGNYELVVNTGLTSGQILLKEDNTAGAGPGGGTGIFSGIFDPWPTGITSMNFGIKNITVPEWPTGVTLSLAEFQKARLSFRWKLPLGRQMTFALDENLSSSAANRATIGTFTGTGNWESFTGSISTFANSEALRTRLGLSNRNLKLTIHYAGVPFTSGEKVQVDDLSLYYETTGQTLEENVPNAFSSASGGTLTRTVNGAGAGTSATTGTLLNTITPFHDPGVTGMAFRIIEDPAAGVEGNPGHLRCEVTDTPDTGAPWGFSIPGPTVRNWTKGAVTVAQLNDVSLQFAARIPNGVTVQVYAEPPGGSVSARANMGTVAGTGAWQTVTKEFATAGNIEALRTALNTANTTQVQLTFVFPSNPALGEQLALDDVRVLPWRLYSTLLTGGAAGTQQRFLDYLNTNGLVTLYPTFVKSTVAPATGASFSLDNFQVTYFGPDPSAAQTLLPLATTGWKYFVGLAEPSGGLFDPALLSGFPIPPGEEDLYDNPQNFRDWVELYNAGASDVNIGGWGLSDEADTPMKWTFPAGTIIPAGGYKIVMCDDREESNGTATYLHASFSLSATGEAIRLYNASGTLQSAVTSVPDQDAFHSWGKNPNGDGSYGFLDTATPGAANTGSFYSARAKTPDFFAADGITPLNGGFYTGAQTLILNSPTVGATIRYTTDGTEPTETNGVIYSGPITLTPPVDAKSGIVVRARAFLAGLVPSDSRTRTYLLSVNANLKTLPALLLSGDAGRNFFAPHGIMAIVGGPPTYDTWSPTGPTSYNIPQLHGDPAERKIFAEWYYPNGQDGWKDDVGVRVSSSPYSRPRLKLDFTANSPWIFDHTEKPSLNLRWRDDYGNSEMSNPNIIPGNDVNNYNELRIRAGKNDILNPLIIDEVSRRMYRDMGWFSPIGTFATLYINGSFKGVYNPTERLRQKMFQQHYRTTNDFDVRYIGEMVDGDATFFNAGYTALNNLALSPTLANYNAALAYFDPVNIADYFLVCIYIEYNDWPGNNYALQRERVPAGRLRMVMWDAEGAWQRFGNTSGYDTLGLKILNGGTECGEIFRRFYASPEFKLLVADRINKHFFNNGILDDRATNAPMKVLRDTLKAQVQPMLTYMANQTVDDAWMNTHINGIAGNADWPPRRTALFDGYTNSAAAFQQPIFSAARGLWPATRPATFSQHGGTVPANYPLVVTSPSGGTIYYTLDGSDPRLAGGSVSPTAQIYTGAIPLNSLGTVKVRVKNGSEWSALTEAYFQPGAVIPAGSMLIVSEINYHPPAPTSAEEALGFVDSDDFEFIRLTNVSAFPLDLRQVQFTAGITFTFGTGDVLALPPGGNVLVIKKRAAFEARYGTSLGAMIAGEYGGSLNNGGEQIRLDNIGTTTTNLALFSYKDDSDPTWPATPDGYGPTLVLKTPTLAPNPSVGTNWSASAQPGGSPGGVTRTLNYTAWRNLAFDPGDASNNAISGMTADPDGDGLPNLIEYGLGGTPFFNDSTALLGPGTIQNSGGTNYLTYSYRVNAGATDASVTPQVSGNLVDWFSGAGNVLTISGPTVREDGINLFTVRDTTPATGGNRSIRLRVVGP